MFSVLVIRLRSLRLLRVSGIVMRLRMFLLLITFLKASHSFRNQRTIKKPPRFGGMKTYNWEGVNPDGYFLDKLEPIPSALPSFQKLFQVSATALSIP